LDWLATYWLLQSDFANDQFEKRITEQSIGQKFHRAGTSRPLENFLDLSRRLLRGLAKGIPYPQASAEVGRCLRQN
jgi:hypothetical protein